MNKKITIVAASDIKIQETLKALYISSLYLKPCKTIFFSSKNKTSNKKYSFITLQKIKPLKTINDYSSFIIYELNKYIETTHILIVQWDGYVINPKKWSDTFLEYDYVGAPFVPRINDYSYSRDRSNNFFVIGNGGFSLRSKKLIEAPSKYKLIDDKFLTNSNEDGFFCVLHRIFLESKGFKWAPFDISKSFSIEAPLSFSQINDLPLGFHGRKVLYFVKLKRLIDIIVFGILLKFLPKNDYIFKRTKK